MEDGEEEEEDGFGSPQKRDGRVCTYIHTHTFIERAYIHQVKDLPNFFCCRKYKSRLLFNQPFLSLSLSICVFENLHVKEEKQGE